MIVVVGGVLSHNPAFATRSQIAQAMVFHVVCMVAGVWCLQRAAARGTGKAAPPAAV